ncbi:MAG: single-stranded DNA-binding protein [Jiangellaceae bacterium]
MSLPELRGQGRTLTDPRTGTTNGGTPWCSLLIKFPAWRKTDDGWEEQPDSPVANVSAYDDLAAVLAEYGKGTEIGIHGTTKLTVWRDKPQFQVTATQIWTPERKARSSTSSSEPGSTADLAAARVSASASLRNITGRAESVA